MENSHVVSTTTHFIVNGITKEHSQTNNQLGLFIIWLIEGWKENMFPRDPCDLMSKLSSFNSLVSEIYFQLRLATNKISSLRLATNKTVWSCTTQIPQNLYFMSGVGDLEDLEETFNVENLVKFVFKIPYGGQMSC